MTSGALIREARLRAGLTQAELARRAGTTQSAVARWESGRTRPSFEALSDLVEQCGLELRVAVVDRDPDDAALIESNLALTPAQRLEQLERTVAFIRTGRARRRRPAGKKTG